MDIDNVSWQSVLWKSKYHLGWLCSASCQGGGLGIWTANLNDNILEVAVPFKLNVCLHNLFQTKSTKDCSIDYSSYSSFPLLAKKKKCHFKEVLVMCQAYIWFNIGIVVVKQLILMTNH